MASGTTRWRSDLAPHGTSEKLTGWSQIRGNKSVCGSVTATDFRAKRKANAPVVQATSYIKFGTNQYIFFGASNYGQAMAMATLLLVVTTTAIVMIERIRLPGSGEF